MFMISSTLRQSKAALLKLIPLADVRMASGEGSQSNTPADEVSPPAEMANLDELPPSQAQRVLEAALQDYRRMDDREPGETTVTAFSLLAGGLIPTSSSTGESLPQYGAVVQGTVAPPLARHGCSLPRLHASSQAPRSWQLARWTRPAARVKTHVPLWPVEAHLLLSVNCVVGTASCIMGDEGDEVRD